MDELVGPEASAIVMIAGQGDPPEWKRARPRQGRGGEAARPVPRPGRPAQVPDRHRASC